ncbi:unnamed protein product [Nippostrongylus brasiliensis]|uniref:VASt domain-containing protein n=1 Tax=Nippostrongylus brasiliensis TaxID=27835 RepID=A0A0N4XJB3_NIPBR|nr:unnamed protein product [Nippostrongylus brasiliensis]
MEAINIKKKATQFQSEEAALLVRLYVQNYADYHSKFTSGGRLGKSVREVFHEQWADAVSSLGFASRTKNQIDERIRNDRKRVQSIVVNLYATVTIAITENQVESEQGEDVQSTSAVLKEEEVSQGGSSVTTMSEPLFTTSQERKPTLRPLPSVDTEEEIIEEEPQAIREQPQAIQEQPQAIQGEPQAIPLKRKRSYASIAREKLGSFTDARTALYEEEGRLAKFRQNESKAAESAWKAAESFWKAAESTLAAIESAATSIAAKNRAEMERMSSNREQEGPSRQQQVPQSSAPGPVYNPYYYHM